MYKRKANGTFTKDNVGGKRFEKGNIPWNKGKKGIRLNPETEFKENEHIGKDHPCWKGGIQKSGKDGIYLWIGKNTRIRRSRQVYIDTYGEIPKGHVIYHKDGNKENDDPKNLEAITRAELVKRNCLDKRGV